jgi:hypothetical protein
MSAKGWAKAFKIINQISNHLPVGEYGLRKHYATAGLGCQLRVLDVMGFLLSMW